MGGIIIHPTCTSVCVSGNHVYAAGKPRHFERVKQAAAIEADYDLCKEFSDNVCLENPIGVLPTYTNMGRADQIIQPNWFGDDASKATCYWLKGFTPLEPTEQVPGREVEWPRGSGKIVLRWANQTDSGQNRLGPDEGRAMERARTYPGPAAAMASQWGHLIKAQSDRRDTV